MQNIIMVNQPTRVKIVKRFLESRGISRYAFVKDADELFQYLLVESSNIHVFDFYLDMSILNTLSDMRDSVNTLTVYTPDPKIGEPYLTLTDDIYIMPDEVDLLCWFWDSQTCNLNNVLACRASRKPFCLVSLPQMNVRPERIQVNVQSKAIPAKYSLASGAVKNTKVNQLAVGISVKGKKIIDKGEVRKQIGIFDDTPREIDLPVLEDGSTAYAGQEFTDKPISTGFSFSLPTHEKKIKEPKQPKGEKQPKAEHEKFVRRKMYKLPKAMKPPKEPKQRKQRVKNIPLPADDESEVLSTESVVSSIPELGIIVTVANGNDVPSTPHLDGPDEFITAPKKHDKPKPIKQSKPAKPTDIFSQPLGEQIVEDNGIEQDFGTLSGKASALEQLNIDTSEADLIAENEKLKEDEQRKAQLLADEAERRRILEEKLAIHGPKKDAPVQVEKPKEQAPKKRIEIVLPTATEDDSSLKRKKPNLRLAGKGSVVYTTIGDYLYGNKLLSFEDHSMITKYVKEMSRPGKPLRYGDVALERGLITADDLVLATAKIYRMEVLTWRQLKDMPVMFDDFTRERCKELKFFRTADDADGNVQIIVSASTTKLDSAIRRLFDSPHIRYTIEQYIDKKLE
ncbi:MAG: hypothetical protein RSC43_01030 [Clostridia bacterium]